MFPSRKALKPLSDLFVARHPTDEDADAFKKVYADDLTDDEDVDGLEEEADIISPLVEDECSPSPDSEVRNEFIDHHEIQIAARRKKAEQREREEEV